MASASRLEGAAATEPSNPRGQLLDLNTILSRSLTNTRAPYIDTEVLETIVIAREISCPVVQSHAWTCPVVQSHAWTCPVVQSHAWSTELGSSKEARVGVVKHIRDIYRNATKTIIVREAGGFNSCCAAIIAEYRSVKEDRLHYLRDPAEILDPIQDHMNTHHPTGLREIWFERVWPLQELQLSDSIQFAVCQDDDENQAGTKERSLDGMGSKVDQLLSAADLWVRRGKWVWALGAEQSANLRAETSREGRVDSEVLDNYFRNNEVLSRRQKARKEFIAAILGDGTASRGMTVESPSSELKTSPFEQLRQSQESARETSKPRDFILAVMAQFKWYDVPSRAVSADFGMFYEDCVMQIKSLFDQIQTPSRSLHFGEDIQRPQDITAKITRGLVEGSDVNASDSSLPSRNVPIPRTLGDFCMMLSYSRYDDPQWCEPQWEFPSSGYWKLQSISGEDSADYILDVISRSLWFANFKRQSIFLQQWERWKKRRPALDEALRRLDTRTPVAERSDDAENKREVTADDIREQLEILGPPGVDSLLTQICGYHGFVRSIPLHKIKEDMVRRGDISQATRIRWSRHAVWEQVVKPILDHDNFEFKEATLGLATTIACGLGLSALPWIRKHLKPQVLVLYDAKSVERKPLHQILCFVSKSFQHDDHDSAEISAYDRLDAPYIRMRTANCKEARMGMCGIVGAAARSIVGAINGIAGGVFGFVRELACAEKE
ncbi:hypothetical protein F5883DRAFT_696232 [Diaporthe sp. PMI_573]|nr:hypothetical protein F5883DRAFT_696232 [Diaporthaceae sp. PMI_573]